MYTILYDRKLIGTIDKLRMWIILPMFQINESYKCNQYLLNNFTKIKYTGLANDFH